jgi:beta-N-acetylhexosaminidase
VDNGRRTIEDDRVGPSSALGSVIRNRWCVLTLVVVTVLVTGTSCASDRSAAPADPSSSSAAESGAPTTAASTSTTAEIASSSVAPSTMPVLTTTTTTTTTTAAATTTTTIAPPPTATVTSAQQAQLLAGSRVLCTFAGPAVPPAVLDRVRAGTAAGVLLFASNLASADQARADAESIQEAASGSPSGLPAIVAADQEGGIVARVPGPPSGSASELGTRSVSDITVEGEATAENLLLWGINVDLAPVADVVRPGSFEQRQHRSFSGDPAVAAAAVAAFVDGLRTGGSAATLKHFPGLGASSGNTDDTLSAVALSSDELDAVDSLPFASGIAAGAQLVMMSSAVYPAYDSVPAVASRTVIQDVLRGRLGFTGVVISDALDTPALARLGSLGQAAVAAAAAGVDLFIAGGADACIEIQSALAAAIDSGVLPTDQAIDAAARVDTLRRTLSLPGTSP